MRRTFPVTASQMVIALLESRLVSSLKLLSPVSADAKSIPSGLHATEKPYSKDLPPVRMTASFPVAASQTWGLDRLEVARRVPSGLHSTQGHPGTGMVIRSR